MTKQAMTMTNKVVLITGANGGLGTHVTQAFLNTGAIVVGASPKISSADFSGGNFTAIPTQISGAESAKRLVDETLERFGKLDVLVHTVGGFAGGQKIEETDDSTFQRMFEMNVNSVFNMVRAAVPALRATKDGCLVAIGSRAAVHPGPAVGAYSASKAAMVSIIRTVALENKDAGLRANTVLPGTMDTPANRRAMPDADRSKWVQPSAVASLIVWLASDDGRSVNGAAIPVYGDEV